MKISCISQNVMADMYTLNHANDRYGHVKDKPVLEWNNRYPKLIQTIFGHDIICLQEVEIKNIPLSQLLLKKLKNIELTNYKKYPNNIQELIKNTINCLQKGENIPFFPFLIPELEKPDSKLLNPKPINENFINDLPNYDYIHHFLCNVKTNVCDKYTNPIGNMILWNKDKFELVDFTLNSYSVSVKLKHIETNIDFLLVNLHLKAGQYSCIKDRDFQLKSCFKLCTKIFNNGKTIIVGDFNDKLRELSLNRKVIEDNKFTILDSYKTCDIYNHENDTHSYCEFDHVASYDMDVIIGAAFELNPIPNEKMPSDHYPLIFYICL